MGTLPEARQSRTGIPSARPRPRALELALVLLCMAGVGVLAVGFGVLMLGRARETAEELSRYGNLDQIGVSIGMYCSDYDNRFPLAENWCDAVGPQYVRNLDCFSCPALLQVRCGYSYNAALSGFDQSNAKPPPNLVMACDGLGGWNAAGGPERFAPRHRGSGLVIYVDCRREWRRARDRSPLTWQP
jgi:hypothetical protein